MMAVGYYMNMEKLSLGIAEKHKDNMTDNNYDNNNFISEEFFINNIENGFVVITQLNCYIESFLNTIMNGCMNYSGEKLLKCSVEEKIEMIFMYYQKNCSEVKSRHSWEIYRNTTKVRNEMVHYKKTFINDGMGIPNFKLGNQDVAVFFTKSNITNLIKGYQELSSDIAKALGLCIFEPNRRPAAIACRSSRLFERLPLAKVVFFVYAHLASV